MVNVAGSIVLKTLSRNAQRTSPEVMNKIYAGFQTANRTGLINPAAIGASGTMRSCATVGTTNGVLNMSPVNPGESIHTATAAQQPTTPEALVSHYTQLLGEYREFTGASEAPGLTIQELTPHIAKDPDLRSAIRQAHRLAYFPSKSDSGELALNKMMQLTEKEAITECHSGLLNFYPEENLSPVFPVAGQGGWYLGHKGVFYDVASYGKDPFGHNPEEILEVMGKPTVSKNMMYANPEQARLMENLSKALGVSPDDFVYQTGNTGSDGMELAFVNIDCFHKSLVESGQLPADQKPTILVIKKGFHGRTERPSELSDSSAAKYRSNFVNSQSKYHVVTVEMNDSEALKETVRQLVEQGAPPVAMSFEPIQGEGNPGVSISPEFWETVYTLAREESADKPRFMVVADSVQAGAWRSGEFSLFSYDQYRQIGRPDFEVFSKAIGGSREAVSLLVIDKPAADYFKVGVYGNTRAGNPHGLAVVNKVFEMMTPEVKSNIVERSEQFLESFNELKAEFPQIVLGVQGTGLLLSLEIDISKVPVMGPSGLELQLRNQGLDIIHGGDNNFLRLTPNYLITEDHVELVVAKIRSVLEKVEL